MRPLPAPFDAIAAGRPARIGVTGPALLGSRLLTKDLAFPAEERDAFHLRGLLPGPGPDHRGAGGPGARAPAGQARRPGALHRAGRAPGPQRDAVLPAARGAPRRVPAHRLHAHGRARVPGVQPHPPADARHLDHARRRRPHPGGAAPGPLRGRAAHRGHRQRADPGPGRPGRRRHGHPHRQARAVHGGVRHPPRARRCPSRSTWAPTTRACSTTRCTWATGRRGCAARPTTRSWRRSWRASRRSGRAASSSSRTSSSTTRCASSTATSIACPSFNDDIQGTAAVVVGGRARRGCGPPAGPSPTRGSCSSGAGAAGIGIARLLRLAMREAGLRRPPSARRSRSSTTHGLVHAGRTDLDADEGRAWPMRGALRMAPTPTVARDDRAGADRRSSWHDRGRGHVHRGRSSRRMDERVGRRSGRSSCRSPTRPRRPRRPRPTSSPGPTAGRWSRPARRSRRSTVDGVAPRGRPGQQRVRLPGRRPGRDRGRGPRGDRPDVPARGPGTRRERQRRAPGRGRALPAGHRPAWRVATDRHRGRPGGRRARRRGGRHR